MNDDEKPELEATLRFYGIEILRMGNGWRKVTCPTAGHEDRVASCSVSFEYQWINCKGCGFRGDALDLIQEREGFDFKQALAFAVEAGLVEGRQDMGRGVRRFSGRGVSNQSRNRSTNRRHSPARVRRPGDRD